MRLVCLNLHFHLMKLFQQVFQLQSIDKLKSTKLKVALTNYAADNNFQTLMSTFTVETVPNHLEIFKGKI